MRNQLSRLLEPIRARVSSIVARAVLRAVDNAHQRQELRVAILGKEVASTVERFENYGFTSWPFIDGKAGVVLVFPQGCRDHPIAIAVDDKSKRPSDLEEGESRLWAHNGAQIRVKADGTIKIEAPSRVEVEAPEVAITGANSVEIDSSTTVEITGTTEVKVSSSASVSLECSPSSVVVTPAGVTITGALVDIVQA